MPVASLDRRTRSDADVHLVSPDELFTEQLPPLLDRHGHLAAAGIEALGAPPLAIEVGDRAWSLTRDGTTVGVREGIADGALVVTLHEQAFSDWAQLQRSFGGMMVAQELRFRDGDERDISVWDSLWLTLLEGWPVVDDELQFLDRDGGPLDLGRSFTPDDDPADIAHFLREAGYLHLRGWLDPDDMARISEEIDEAVPRYVEGDGRSWWAVMEDGTHRCVRLQQFLPHSPTTAAVLQSERWERLRRTLAADDELVQGRPGDHVIEALIKPPGVERGISDVGFHRDCHLGGHPYGCSGVDIGFAVTGSDESTGRLRVVAGSHRVAIPVSIALTDPYLPVVSVWTEPGDLTVHLSCTLHESTPPVTSERRVMYSPFKLAPRPGDVPPAPADPGLRDRLGKLLASEEAPSSKEAWADRAV
jgi:Phytanoyl-CoA dioxygenase (PhyH)